MVVLPASTDEEATAMTETTTQATRMDCPSSLKGDALLLSTSTKLKKGRGKKSQSDDASELLHSAVVLSPVSKTAKQKRKLPQKNAQPSVRSEDKSSAAISPQCTDSPLTSVHPQHDMVVLPASTGEEKESPSVITNDEPPNFLQTVDNTPEGNRNCQLIQNIPLSSAGPGLSKEEKLKLLQYLPPGDTSLNTKRNIKSAKRCSKEKKDVGRSKSKSAKVGWQEQTKTKAVQHSVTEDGERVANYQCAANKKQRKKKKNKSSEESSSLKLKSRTSPENRPVGLCKNQLAEKDRIVDKSSQMAADVSANVFCSSPHQNERCDSHGVSSIDEAIKRTRLEDTLHDPNEFQSLILSDSDASSSSHKLLRLSKKGSKKRRLTHTTNTAGSKGALSLNRKRTTTAPKTPSPDTLSKKPKKLLHNDGRNTETCAALADASSKTLLPCITARKRKIMMFQDDEADSESSSCFNSDSKRKAQSLKKATQLKIMWKQDLLSALPPEFSIFAPPPSVPQPVDLSPNSVQKCSPTTSYQNKNSSEYIIAPDAKYNFNILYRAAQAKMYAGFHDSALKMCKDALDDWFEDADRLVENGASRSKVEALGRSLAGLSCIYVFVLTQSREEKNTRKKKQSKHKKQRMANLKSSNSSSPGQQHKDCMLFTGVEPPPPNDNKEGSSTFLNAISQLKRSTSCLAGRHAWPWLSLSRLTLWKALSAAGKHASSVGKISAPEKNGLTNDHQRYDEKKQMLWDRVCSAREEAVQICRKGIMSTHPQITHNFSASPTCRLDDDGKISVDNENDTVTICGVISRSNKKYLRTSMPDELGVKMLYEELNWLSCLESIFEKHISSDDHQGALESITTHIFLEKAETSGEPLTVPVHSIIPNSRRQIPKPIIDRPISLHDDKIKSKQSIKNSAFSQVSKNSEQNIIIVPSLPSFPTERDFDSESFYKGCLVERPKEENNTSENTPALIPCEKDGAEEAEEASEKECIPDNIHNFSDNTDLAETRQNLFQDSTTKFESPFSALIHECISSSNTPERNRTENSETNNKELYSALEWACSTCRTMTFDSYSDYCSHKEQCKSKQACSIIKPKQSQVIPALFDDLPPGEDFFLQDEALDVMDYLVEFFGSAETGTSFWEQKLLGKATRKDGLFEKTEEKSFFPGQVGLRCLYCRNERAKVQCSVVFPRSCRELHKAAWRLMLNHIDHCRYIPRNIVMRYETMRRSVQLDSPLFKNYWRDIRKEMCFEDVVVGKHQGIVFS